MRIAGHNEHQYFERTLRPSFLDVATSVRGSLNIQTHWGLVLPRSVLLEGLAASRFVSQASSLSVQSWAKRSFAHSVWSCIRTAILEIDWSWQVSALIEAHSKRGAGANVYTPFRDLGSVEITR